MRQHTKEFKNEIQKNGRQLDSKIIIKGSELVLGAEDLFSVTPVTNSTLLKSVMKEVDFESKKQIGIGQEINVKSGVKVNGEYEYIDYGNYSVYKSEYKAETDTYSHICYDKMLKTMIDYTPLDITYPINLREYINAIATKCGLEFADKNSAFANYNTAINEDHFSNGNYTFRDVLDYIAQLVGGWLCINDNDELEIRYPELAKNYDKVSGENVSFISNVEDEINTIIVDGKSTQETTSGKNLNPYKNTDLKFYNLSNFFGINRDEEQITITCTSTTSKDTAFGFESGAISVPKNTDIYLSFDYYYHTDDTANNRIQLEKENGGSKWRTGIYTNEINNKALKKISPSVNYINVNKKTWKRISCCYNTGENTEVIFKIGTDLPNIFAADGTANVQIKNIMLSTSSDITYEPYTNGAAPNPEFPMDIHTISGDNEIKVVNKNFAYLKDGTYTKENDTAIINNNLITLNTSSSTGSNSYFSFGNGYTQTWAPAGDGIKNVNDLKLTGDGGNYIATIYTNKTISGSISFRIYTSNNRELMTNIGSYMTSTINISLEDGEHIKDYGLWSGSASIFNDYQIRVQLEKGTTATPYEEYKSNTSSIDLQGNELCSLPNGVKDELVIENGRAKIIKRIGNVVLDGSENWNKIQEATTSTDYYYAYTIVYDKLIGSKYTGISNNFIVKQGTYITASSTVDSDMLGVGGTGNGKIRMFIKKSRLTEMTTTELKSWLSTHNTQVDYELAEPQIIELGDSAIPYIDGINYMHISSNMDTTFSLVYPHKTISGNAYDYTEFNPPGVKQTGTIKSYNAITGIGTLMPQYPFMYTPMQGDSYAVISNIYNVSGFSYLYNTPYNTVNSLYTHGYTATWATPDGLCVLPDDFNITLQFSPDGNFFYDQNGVYQEVVNLITTETDDANNEGEFTIKIDKNKLIFVQNPDISLELPFYTNTTQVFVLSSASVAQINNDYVWDDTATWTDTYTWVEGGTSLERVCNHWWKVQITNTGIKIEEIFPTT